MAGRGGGNRREMKRGRSTYAAWSAGETTEPAPPPLPSYPLPPLPSALAQVPPAPNRLATSPQPSWAGAGVTAADHPGPGAEFLQKEKVRPGMEGTCNKGQRSASLPTTPQQCREQGGEDSKFTKR